MKGQRKKYEEIKKLPPSAVKVSTYATNNGISVAGAYKRHKRGAIRIVEFEGINFVIPEKINTAS